MKRQRVKFTWDLYWENKTYKLKRFITMRLEREILRLKELCTLMNIGIETLGKILTFS